MPSTEIIDADEKRMIRRALRERRGAPVFTGAIVLLAMLHSTAMVKAWPMKNDEPRANWLSVVRRRHSKFRGLPAVGGRKNPNFLKVQHALGACERDTVA